MKKLSWNTESELWKILEKEYSKENAAVKCSGIYFGTLLNNKNYKVNFTQSKPQECDSNEVFEVKFQSKPDAGSYYLRVSKIPKESKIRPIIENHGLPKHNLYLHHLIACLDGYTHPRDGLELHHLNGYSADNRSINTLFVPVDIHQSFHSTHPKKEIPESLDLLMGKSFFLSITYKDLIRDWNQDEINLSAEFIAAGSRRDKAMGMASVLVAMRKIAKEEMSLVEIEEMCKMKVNNSRTLKNHIKSLIESGKIFKKKHGRYSLQN